MHKNLISLKTDKFICIYVFIFFIYLLFAPYII